MGEGSWKKKDGVSEFDLLSWVADGVSEFDILSWVAAKLTLPKLAAWNSGEMFSS